jgi:hypothetical protein
MTAFEVGSQAGFLLLSKSCKPYNGTAWGATSMFSPIHVHVTTLAMYACSVRLRGPPAVHRCSGYDEWRSGML